jgi:hypothetical protein
LKGVTHMKTLKYIWLLSAFSSLTACSSTYHASTATDDIYYNASDARSYDPVAPATEPVSNNYASQANNYDQPARNDQPDYYSSEQQTDGNGTTYVTNNYNYNSDDYYDYAYSSRLRRFYDPYVGYSYYDPIYTNAYWYDPTPNLWGVSLYTTYNWWAPATFYTNPVCYGGFGWGWNRPGWNINIGWGGPSCWNYGWGWNNGWGWNRPWGYNYGWGWNDPWGWNNPYAWNNGWGWNNPYAWNNPWAFNTGLGPVQPFYYNSFESTNHYYGPRSNTASNSSLPAGARPVRNFAQSYEDIYGGRVNNGNPNGLNNQPNSLDTRRPVDGNDGRINTTVGGNSDNKDGLQGGRSNTTPATSGRPTTVQPDRGLNNNQNAEMPRSNSTRPNTSQGEMPGGTNNPTRNNTDVKDIKGNSGRGIISGKNEGLQNPVGVGGNPVNARPNTDRPNNTDYARPRQPFNNRGNEVGGSRDNNQNVNPPSGGSRGNMDTRPNNGNTRPSAPQQPRWFEQPRNSGGNMQQDNRTRDNNNWFNNQPRQENRPRIETPRQENRPRLELPRQENRPRMETPRQENRPRIENNRPQQSQPRISTPQRQPSSPSIRSGGDGRGNSRPSKGR